MLTGLLHCYKMFPRENSLRRREENSKERPAGTFSRGRFTTAEFNQKGDLQMEKKKSFTESFARLSSDFGPVPWWCWTGKMEKKEVIRQLKDMKEKGINEFFIMAMYGLEFPSFLKESYWDFIGFVLKACEKEGMKAWLYDDLNWPSGTAAGYLLREHPEYRSSVMELKEKRLLPGEKADIESMMPEAGKILYAGFEREGAGLRDILIEAEKWWEVKGKRYWVNETGSPGRLMVLVKTPVERVLLSSAGTADSWNQHGYGDMLCKKAVKTWMSYIHCEYEKRFKRYFGSTLRGFFFDEPYANISKSMGFAWTEKLFPEFKKRYGYRLEENFRLLLSEGSCPESVKARIDYYGLMTDLFSKNFAKTVGDWCAKKGVSVTGHCMAEESISFSNKVNGDIHEFIKWIQVPGMDMLAGCLPGTPLETRIGDIPYDYPLLTLTAKRISSTARYTGAKRTMCEAFGVRDWNATLAQQKKDTDWLASMGISLVNDNALIYSIADFRKRAISGKHFSQPWWQYYRIYADYCRRVSLYASFAPLDADTAVLYSTTSAHAGTTFRVGMESHFWNETPQSRLMLEMILASTETLRESHVDFEMLFEDVLKKARVSKGVLKCRNGEFKRVIVPGCYVIEGVCAKKLETFAESGGEVIWLGRLPEWLYEDKKIIPYKAGSSSKVITCRDRKTAGAKLKDYLLPRLPGKWEIENREDASGIWATARTNGKEYMVFLANHTGKKKSIAFRHRLKGFTSVMDVDDGKIYGTAAKKAGEWSRIKMDIPDGKSLIINIKEESLAKERPFKHLAASNLSGKKFLLGGSWDFSLKGENHFLPKIFVKTDPLARGEKENWHKKPLDKTWAAAYNGKLSDSFTAEEAPFYWVRGKFNLGFAPPPISFITDNDRWQKLFINGSEAGKPSGCNLWDGENRVFQDTNLCRRGKNEFAFLVKSSSWRSQAMALPGFNQKGFIEPVVISGNFSVREKKKGTSLMPLCGKVKTGGWNSHGYPHLAGTGIYSRRVTFTRVPEYPRLVIEDAFTVVKVTVNGKEAGTRAWKPYVFSLEGLIQKGSNRIEISVTNSLGNILRRLYSGRLGEEKAGGITGRVYLLL